VGETGAFPVGDAEANAQVDFANTSGSPAFGTIADDAANEVKVFGAGTGQIFAWNPAPPEGDGIVLGKMDVTEVYKKISGRVDPGDSDPKAGKVTIEFQGKCDD